MSVVQVRPYRVEYDCDYRQRATTHGSREAAFEAASAAVEEATWYGATATISYRDPRDVFLPGEVLVGRAGRTVRVLSDPLPEWWTAP